ncbi:oxidoreductase NAD-binding domain-containing 1 [Lecanosticta acicola]|uniref:Oxidoreductase NAD-binding domain-containing 1 n=1 Tax=Lecanosticta acicola TaxID=111012 RepID=A0AAI9EB74_9PEZI|nr:oxidoreductase NAD-binding domain-containing 1 [Lecanosticta acicola]
MATIRSSLPHVERTAAEPREDDVEPVVLANVREVNDTVRLLRLNALDPNHTIKFLPGQWLDTFIPSLRQAGGFTITSTPDQARPSAHSPPYLELAVQKSTNPPAAWLWRPTEEILGSKLAVRVGGSFTWPPPHLDPQSIERLVLVAGGVGINPLVSIFSHLVRTSTRPREVHFVYASKATSDLDPHKILFLPRLQDLIAAEADPSVTLSMFLTGTGYDGVIEHGKLPNRTYGRRINRSDLLNALDGYQQNVSGAKHRDKTACYVCGPPRMTDELVEFLRKQEGMTDERVLCEKWW